MGSSLLPGYNSLCVENFTDPSGLDHHFVYGPFAISLVEDCISYGGGLMCYRFRWQGDFYLFLNTLQGAQGATHCDPEGLGLFHCDGTPFLSFLSFPLLPSSTEFTFSPLLFFSFSSSQSFGTFLLPLTPVLATRCHQTQTETVSWIAMVGVFGLFLPICPCGCFLLGADRLLLCRSLPT